jgi:hypothetical protein
MTPEEALAEVVAATERRAPAMQDQADAIRNAIRVGVPVLQLVTVTGLSRARIYQIRDGKR